MAIFLGINIGNNQPDDGVRRFVKKWNSFKKEFVYKEVKPAGEKINIISRKDFFILRIQEDVEVINDDEMPPEDEDTGRGSGRSLI